ncbi:dual specificity tyrosine-phosphorylation-regulated kinase 4-like [Pangasianodon hypophthalmus]|uniref:dual specificity tyrosine-phosphorylation-regulated kinase 4-like n=1 Tax=Pangasianodon hypophthalmus TaxID=310915 RepID=UPI001480A14C|nr:dual specificity tyrosine-phosphorylation-regulated kinase 4-like [Pangasianodon hypophthalmus]
MPGPSGARRESEDRPEQVNTQCHFNNQQHRKKPQFPLTPTDVVRHFGDRLTYFDLKEISEYSEIWYLGKKIGGSLRNAELNGNIFQVSHDHIAYRYEVLEMLGEGSYGQVFKCLDHKTNEMVAIKIIQDMRTYREEVEILDYLRKKDRNGSYNIVFMKTHFYFRKRLCIVYELLGPTLSELKRIQRFSKADVRRIAKDVVRCLRLLEKEKIIHGDLKPGNITLKEKGQGVKVIDFGGSSFEQKKLFPGIHTRIYSPPEVLMKNHYTTAIDMWSLGCILAELHTGRYLFPGVDDYDQIALIMEVLGRPPTEFVQEEKTWNFFYNHKGHWRKIYDSKDRVIKPRSKDLKTILDTDDLQFLDFIQRCLNWNPEKRLTPMEAMKHPWLHSDSCRCRARTRAPKQAS